MINSTCGCPITFKCAYDLYSCLEEINLGTAPAGFENEEILIHIINGNGVEYIKESQLDVLDASLDVTAISDSSFINHNDGMYIIYLTPKNEVEAENNITYTVNSKIDMTCEGGTYTAIGFNVKKAIGDITDVIITNPTIELLP